VPAPTLRSIRSQIPMFETPPPQMFKRPALHEATSVFPGWQHTCTKPHTPMLGEYHDPFCIGWFHKEGGGRKHNSFPPQGWELQFLRHGKPPCYPLATPNIIGYNKTQQFDQCMSLSDTTSVGFQGDPSTQSKASMACKRLLHCVDPSVHDNIATKCMIRN
jgi:hypothetical protein